MSEVTLSLSRTTLPVQYGNTAGSLLERFYVYATQFVEGSAAINAPSGARRIEVETEYEGVFFAHIKRSPAITDTDQSSAWVSTSTIDAWLEIREVSPEEDQRSVILKINGGMYYVATTSEDFMTTLILSQTP